jgi:hypothetical protein
MSAYVLPIDKAPSATAYVFMDVFQHSLREDVERSHEGNTAQPLPSSDENLSIESAENVVEEASDEEQCHIPACRPTADENPSLLP